ncbi:MAG TPA: type II toxin-antitoxin system RelE/ParE family toxin [Bryobacteraceae bacterium]|nr:type II toxin-antitoxin system RelE/ParE family toxin [Bryobacteraceae bacterium]
MSARLTFHRMTEQELNDAALFYDSESAGLGGAFLTEIERSVRMILDQPQVGLVVSGTVRRLLARRFPYAVLYSVRPDEVRVLAIMHMKRRPMYWAGRR